MNKLTAIIPFLNEGVEIENTLQSIRATTGESVDILIINDCSTDEFDYETPALRYNARYYKNKERMGVAASRNLGVSMITTPYFLLLDGHMRFYDDQWVKRIVEELKQDENVLLCCQTKHLHKKELQESSKMQVFGAYIDLINEENLLTAVWNVFEADSTATVEDIACVLGAGYACSRQYWQYLKGLSGLMYYGYDETYISLKVWLSGGKCKLLKDVVVGHLYREAFPYTTEHVYTVYNRLLIAELLLPDHLKETLFSQSKLRLGKIFVSANRILEENATEIAELKQYYQSIITVDFNTIYAWNVKIAQKHEDLTLQRIAGYLMEKSSQTKDSGLLYGKMGIVIFFAHYAKYTGNQRYEDFFENLLDEIFEAILQKTSIDFQSGLCGIGWGIEYLVQNGLMEGNTDEILEDVDKLIMELDLEKIEDISLETGLAGIAHYVYGRMVSACMNKRKYPFQQIFLIRLSERMSGILSEKKETEYSEILSHFLLLLEKNTESEKSIQLNQIITLPYSFDIKFELQLLGLKFGYAGVGIRKMRII